MALLTEIHYLLSPSPLDIEGEYSQTAASATVKSYWCGFCELFMEGGDGIFPGSWWFSWPETGVVGVVFDFVCYSIPLSHQLSLSSLTLQFTPSNTQRCTPCLCADCCCLIARSPSRSQTLLLLFASIGWSVWLAFAQAPWREFVFVSVWAC